MRRLLLRWISRRSQKTIDKRRTAQTILYVGFGPEAAFHVLLWYPFCATVDRDVLVAVRSPRLYLKLRREHPDIPVIHIPSYDRAVRLTSQLDDPRVVFYVSNSGTNLHLLKLLVPHHLFLGHGDSDKQTSAHRFLRVYDELWVSGRAQIARNRAFEGSDRVRSRIVGRPEIRELLTTRLPSDEECNYVLYLPTWEGPNPSEDYSSVRMAEMLITRSAQRLQLKPRVKLHPWTGRRQRSLRKTLPKIQHAANRHGGEMVDPDARATNLMFDARALVCDVSSVAVDFLTTGRPIFCYLPPDIELSHATGEFTIRDIAYFFSGVDDLESLLQRVVQGEDDPLATIRDRALHYFVDVDATRASRFEHELQLRLAPTSR